MPLRNRRLEMGNKPVKGLADAVDDQDAVPKAQMDAAISTAIATVDLSGYVPTARTISAGTGLTGGGDLSANRTLTLADTAVTPASYTNASITVDQQGRITAASNGAAAKFTETFKTSANQSITSSTTFADATDMTFPISANTLTAFEFIYACAGGAGGGKLAVNGPTLTSLFASANGAVAATAYDSNIVLIGTTGTQVGSIRGLIECSASGTVALRFAQQASNIDPVIMRKGGIVRYAVVA